MLDNNQVRPAIELSNSQLADYANSILAHNKLAIILMFLLLWAIGLPLELAITPSPWAVLCTHLLQEILGLLFFVYLFSLTIPSRITSKKLVATISSFVFVWLLTNLHTIVILLNSPASLVTPIIGLASVLTIYLLAFYFFYIPYLTENCDLISSFRKANLIVSSPRILALRVISTALIVSLLIRQSFQFFKLSYFNVSQQNSLILDILSSLSHSAYWAISTLLCLGIALLLTESKVKSNYPIVHQKGPCYFLLGGAGIGKILLSVLLLGAGSVYLTLTSPPEFNSSIIFSYYDKEKKLFIVDLKVESPSGNLSNLQPMFFRIAGEDGYPLSEMPSKIEPIESISAIASGASQAELKLSFQILNRQDDFDRLEDKTLWYLSHKIIKID